MEQAPEEQASAKLAQHLAVAVQVAESVMRLRQQRAERSASTDNAVAGAARAERLAQHSADRLVWSPALDRDWLAKANLHDLGRAWGSATGWADTDPTADAAARRVETRLSEVAPNAMARYDELRETGWTRTDAMGDVLGSVASEAHGAAATSDGRRVFVADAGPSAGASDAVARADTAAFFARASEGIPDDLSTPRVDEHAEGVLAATPQRDEEAVWLADAGKDAFAHRRVTDAGTPHPADVAADSHPTPFTQVSAPSTRALPSAAAAPAAARPRTLSR